MDSSVKYSTNGSVDFRVWELISSNQMAQSGAVTFKRAQFGDECHTVVYSVENCTIEPDKNNSNKLNYNISIIETAIYQHRQEAVKFVVKGYYSRGKTYYERIIRGGNYNIPFKAIISEYLGARLFK